MNKHTFAICAYKESKYLEKCIMSVMNQNILDQVIIITSTPCEFISNLAKKYNIDVYVNEGEKGLGNDFNFAVTSAKTKYVTVTHQDDIYNKDYLEEFLKYENKCNNIVIAFSKYNEIKNNEIIKLNTNLKIKEIMLCPLKIFNKSRFIKKTILSVGNAICCPSVIFNKDIVGDIPFKTDMKCSLDWDTWLDLIKYKGKFLYIPKYLMSHRIHEDSETTKLINNNTRLNEDYSILRRYWIKPIADILFKLYSKSVETNDVKNG